MEISDKLKEFIGIFNAPATDKEAERIVGESGSTNMGWLDKQDAARHLLGIGEIARVTHPIVAKGVGSLYEFISGSENEEDAKMDEHNNELALSLYNAKSKEELVERVKGLMEKAKYKDFSDKTKPVFLK